MSVTDLLQHLIYIADLNSDEVKARLLSRIGLTVPTVAEQENTEWETFRAKLDRRRKHISEDELDDEDDADVLIVLLHILDESKTPLTIFELMRALQKAKVLSLEFPSTARAQTISMLVKLQNANRARLSTHGLWSASR